MRTVYVGDADFEQGEVVRLVFPPGYKRPVSARVQERRRTFMQATAILSTLVLFLASIGWWL